MPRDCSHSTHVGRMHLDSTHVGRIHLDRQPGLSVLLRITNKAEPLQRLKDVCMITEGVERNRGTIGSRLNIPVTAGEHICE